MTPLFCACGMPGKVVENVKTKERIIACNVCIAKAHEMVRQREERRQRMKRERGK
jgi:hypothetical protein